jgi:2-amino-4-hydroxy-6-hydroxymethyldihydropteridine diphosphokinase
LDLILIGLGANLPSHVGSPRHTLDAALHSLETVGVRVLRRSRYWQTRPVPVSEQPWFVNAVAAAESDLPPAGVLSALHGIEADFGRFRGVRNAARTLDLDLLAYGRRVVAEPNGLTLPHPRLTERAFVLLPLRDVAPDWTHPVSGESLDRLIERLPLDQEAVPQD